MPRMPGEKYTQARQAQAREARKKQYKQYDMFERNPKARKFYNSMAWRNTRAAYIQRHPLCEECERQGRVVAEQQAAVLGAKLEAALERSAKADSAALDALAQARSNGEAVFLEVAKVEAAKNTIANLRARTRTGHDALQGVRRGRGDLPARSARSGARRRCGQARHGFLQGGAL